VTNAVAAAWRLGVWLSAESMDYWRRFEAVNLPGTLEGYAALSLAIPAGYQVLAAAFLAEFIPRDADFSSM